MKTSSLKSFARRHLKPRQLDVATGIYRSIRNGYLRRIRSRVRRRLDKSELSSIRRIRSTTFPNWVEPGHGVYVVGKILYVLETRHTPFTPWTSYDLVITFEDNTLSTIDTGNHLRASYAFTKSALPPIELNTRASDISKRRVGCAFAEAFGYALNVDPRQFVGKAVEKADKQYLHFLGKRAFKNPIRYTSSELVGAFDRSHALQSIKVA